MISILLFVVSIIGFNGIIWKKVISLVFRKYILVCWNLKIYLSDYKLVIRKEF